MDGLLRVPRTRGAVSGVLLVLLGAWGALIPFVGPYFHYAYTPSSAWTYTSGRVWLEVVPGAVALLAGLVLIATTIRPLALTAALAAAAAGAWFVVGTVLDPLWASSHGITPGTPAGTSTLTRVVEQIGFFGGLGVVIVFLGAAAAGRHAVLARAPKAVEAKPEPAKPEATTPETSDQKSGAGLS